MHLRNRQSGLWLILLGIAGMLFYWLTDHRYGLAGQGSVEQANINFPGTVIGLAGSLFILLIGLWLISRKTT